MAVSCPAAECGFSGTLDQVEGHLGGVGDGLHGGVVPADLMESFHGEGSEGVPMWAIAGLVVVAIVLLMAAQSPDSQESEGDEASTETSTAGEVAALA